MLFGMCWLSYAYRMCFALGGFSFVVLGSPGNGLSLLRAGVHTTRGALRGSWRRQGWVTAAQFKARVSPGCHAPPGALRTRVTHTRR